MKKEYLIETFERAKAENWKQKISDAIDKAFRKMMEEIGQEDEAQRLACEMVRESVKKDFLKHELTEAQERFLLSNIEGYEKAFEACASGDDLEFARLTLELQKKQNQYLMGEE